MTVIVLLFIYHNNFETNSLNLSLSLSESESDSAPFKLNCPHADSSLVTAAALPSFFPISAHSLTLVRRTVLASREPKRHDSEYSAWDAASATQSIPPHTVVQGAAQSLFSSDRVARGRDFSVALFPLAPLLSTRIIPSVLC